MTDEDAPQSQPGGRARGISLFAFLMWPVLASAGAVCVVAGLNASFRRAGNWSNTLVEVGVLLLIAAWVSNTVSLISGLIAWVAEGKACPWLMPSGCVVAGSVAAALLVYFG